METLTPGDYVSFYRRPKLVLGVSKSHQTVELEDNRERQTFTFRHVKYVSGIPLTPELLIKNLGYTEVGDTGYWRHFSSKNGLHISMWNTDESPAGFEKKGTFYYTDDFWEFNYLHEWQEFYRLRFKKEMEITWDEEDEFNN